MVNNTSILSNRIDGNVQLLGSAERLRLGQTINFRYIGIRTVTNSTDMNYRVNKRIGFYGGYHYSDRLINTVDSFTLPQFANSTDREEYHVSNHLNAGVLGIRVRPWKPFTINLTARSGAPISR